MLKTLSYIDRQYREGDLKLLKHDLQSNALTTEIYISLRLSASHEFSFVTKCHTG